MKKGKHLRLEVNELRENNRNIEYRGKKLIEPKEEVFVPLITKHHDPATRGHSGQEQTLLNLMRRYYWEAMRKDVDQYVANCQVCGRTKPSWEAAKGLLRPLEIPDAKWTSISVDFIIRLTKQEGYDAVMVVVDRRTKMAHYIPTTKMVSFADTAELFLNHVWKLHGDPAEIISDRGTQFISVFWTDLCKRLGIKRKLSTAYHPETDGQMERRNQMLEHYLRAYVSH